MLGSVTRRHDLGRAGSSSETPLEGEKTALGPLKANRALKLVDSQVSTVDTVVRVIRARIFIHTIIVENLRPE